MSIAKLTNNTYTVEALHQWDRDQVLQVYGLALARVPEVHFSHQGMSRAIVRQARMDAAGVITVDVPNSLLQKPYTITAHICGYNGTTFETIYKLDIPVKARPQPADYTLQDDPEVYSFNALENTVVNAQRDMKSAEATLKETNNTIDATVDGKVKAALPEFLDATLTSKDKAAQAAAVSTAITAAITAAAETQVQIETGSYTGDGTFGANNHTSITFDTIQPMLVMISDGTTNPWSGSVSVDHILFWFEGVKKMGAFSLTCSRAGNTLDWYDKEKADYQFNTEGKEYFYIGIGYPNKEAEQ